MARYKTEFERRFGKKSAGSIQEQNENRSARKRAEAKAKPKTPRGKGPREWSGETRKQLFDRIDREMDAAYRPGAGAPSQNMQHVFDRNWEEGVTGAASAARHTAKLSKVDQEVDAAWEAERAHQERAAKDALRQAVKRGAGFTGSDGDDYTQEARDAVAKDLREQRAAKQAEKAAIARRAETRRLVEGGEEENRRLMSGKLETRLRASMRQGETYKQASDRYHGKGKSGKGGSGGRGQKRVPKGNSTGGRWTK